MSCNCDKSINCEPCAYCTPPGVTCLTTCTPVDPCPDKIDMSCVVYSGTDHNCSDITHSESISPILLQALSLIFNVEVCCEFSADATRIGNAFDFCKAIGSDATCYRACLCDQIHTTPIQLYAFHDTIGGVGNILYIDTACESPASAGYYGANGYCYTLDGNGVILSITSCIPPTTTSTTTTPPPTTTSTSTTTTSSTTTTTTLPPCNCITWDNSLHEPSGTVSYKDCTGVNRTVFMPSYSVVKRCGSSASAPNGNVLPIVGGPCTFNGDAYQCPSVIATTVAPSTFILQCCASPDPLHPITIQPAYPVTGTVPFALGNTYIDDQGRYWIVISAAGTPSVTTGLPLYYTSVGPGSLPDCQSRAATQIALCPGVVPITTLPPAILLGYDVSSAIIACSATRSNKYSNCSVLVPNNGCRLYTTNALTTTVPAGYYSNGTIVYTVVGSGGLITNVATCASVTTTSTSTSTTTAAPSTITITNNTPSNSGITITGLLSPNGTSLPGVIWKPRFNMLAPGKSNNGTFQQPFGQLRVQLTISPTNSANPSGYYIHVSDGFGFTHTDPVPQILTAGTDVDLYSHPYQLGDTITITLNNTP